MDMRIPPLRVKIMLESNPLKSTMLVRGLAVCDLAKPIRSLEETARQAIRPRMRCPWKALRYTARQETPLRYVSKHGSQLNIKLKTVMLWIIIIITVTIIVRPSSDSGSLAGCAVGPAGWSLRDLHLAGRAIITINRIAIIAINRIASITINRIAIITINRIAIIPLLVLLLLLLSLLIICLLSLSIVDVFNSLIV